MDDHSEGFISKVIQMVRQEINGNSSRDEASHSGAELEKELSLLITNYHAAQKEKDCLEMRNIDLLSREIELNSKCVRYQMQVAIMENTTKDQERQLQFKDDELKNIRAILEQRVEDENRDSMRRDILEYELSAKIADNEEILNGMEVLLAEKENVIEQLETKIHQLTEEIFKVNKIIDKQHIELEEREARMSNIAEITCELENENKLLRSKIYKINKKSEILKRSLNDLEDDLLNRKGKETVQDLQRNLKTYESKFDKITDSLLEFGEENECLTVKICDILNEVVFEDDNQNHDCDDNQDDKEDDDDDDDDDDDLCLPVIESNLGKITRSTVLKAEGNKLEIFSGNKGIKSYGMLLSGDTNEEQSAIVISNGNNNRNLTANLEALSENKDRQENDIDSGFLFAGHKNTYGISETHSKNNLLEVCRRATDAMESLSGEIRKQHQSESTDSTGNCIEAPLLKRADSNEEKVLNDLSSTEWHLQRNLIGVHSECSEMMQHVEQNGKGLDELSLEAKCSGLQDEASGSDECSSDMIKNKANGNITMGVYARRESSRDIDAHNLSSTLTDNGKMSLDGKPSDNDTEYKPSDVMSILDEDSNNNLSVKCELPNQDENYTELISDAVTYAGGIKPMQMQSDSSANNAEDLKGMLPEVEIQRDETVPTKEDGDSEVLKDGIKRLCDKQEIDDTDIKKVTKENEQVIKEGELLSDEFTRQENLKSYEGTTEGTSSAPEVYIGKSESEVFVTATEAKNTEGAEEEKQSCVETDFALAVETSKTEETFVEVDFASEVQSMEREDVQELEEVYVKADFAPTVETTKVEEAFVEVDIASSVQALKAEGVKETEEASIEADNKPAVEAPKIKDAQEIEEASVEADFAPAVETLRMEEASMDLDTVRIVEAQKTEVAEQKEEASVETEFAHPVEKIRAEGVSVEVDIASIMEVQNTEVVQKIEEAPMEVVFAPKLKKSEEEEASNEVDIECAVDVSKTEDVQEIDEAFVETDFIPKVDTSKAEKVPEAVDIVSKVEAPKAEDVEKQEEASVETEFAPPVEVPRMEEASVEVDTASVVEAPKVEIVQEIEVSMETDFAPTLERSEKEEASKEVNIECAVEAPNIKDAQGIEEASAETEFEPSVKAPRIEEASVEVDNTSVIEAIKIDDVKEIDEASVEADFVPKVETSKIGEVSEAVAIVSIVESPNSVGAEQKGDTSVETDFAPAVEAPRIEDIQMMEEVVVEADLMSVVEAPKKKDTEKIEATVEVDISPAGEAPMINKASVETDIACRTEALKVADAQSIGEDRQRNTGESKSLTAFTSSEGKIDELKCLDVSTDDNKLALSGKVMEQSSKEIDDKSILKRSPSKQRQRTTEAATMNMRIASPTRWSVEIPSNLVSSLIKENVELRTEVEELLNEKSVLVNEVENLKLGGDAEEKLRYEVDSVVAEKLLLLDQIEALKGIMLDFDEKYKDETTALEESKKRLNVEIEQIKASLVEKEEYLLAAKERENYLVAVNEKRREEIAGLEARLYMLNSEKDIKECKKCKILQKELEETRREVEELKTRTASNEVPRNPSVLDQVSATGSSPESLDSIDDSYGADKAAAFSGANRMKKKKKYAIFCS